MTERQQFENHLNTLQQVARINAIMGNKHMKHCDCGFSYIPFTTITEHLCPNCQKEEIEALNEKVVK